MTPPLMVAIRPFRALRYDPARIPDLSDVIAPPYDVITAEEQEQLYQASPYNIVRLILGKGEPAEAPENNRYTRAQRHFELWRAERVLRYDPTEAVYLIEQTFDDAGRARSRLGFIALLELEEAIERRVYRHEATLAAPKEDRAKLLETLPANLSPIFCVYPDAQGVAQALAQTHSARTPPTARGRIGGGEVRLWAMTDADAIRELARHVSSVSVLIADGHHRFEVAYAGRKRYGAVMSYFVSMADPALIVRPIHRIIQESGPADLQALHRLCIVEQAADLSALLRWLEAGEGQGWFGYFDGQALYRVMVRPDQLARWLMAPPVPMPIAALDVSLLHGLILPQRSVEHAVRYTADANEALKAVGRSEGTSAWLLRGMALQQVYALAAKGLTLPPKSTYFYPKVPSGLTINPFQNSLCADETV